ncbi:hypothetical protein CRYUN_Cryun10bG0044600 [Craigia yunnanensis]
MLMEPNDVIWGSVLAACRMHRNVDMVGYAAERIEELAFERIGIQLLLTYMPRLGNGLMLQRVRGAGHVPDLTNVLLNVDEQEKDYLLGRHSEKLAMAFGLISTNQEMPIRVVKNLRICSDCHSFVKLV